MVSFLSVVGLICKGAMNPLCAKRDLLADALDRKRARPLAAGLAFRAGKGV